MLLALAACGGDDGSSIPATVNPLGDGNNILPFPSSLYEKADPSSPTGIRIDVEPGALPGPIDGEPFDVSLINGRTGWPAAVTILWQYKDGIDPLGLNGPDKIEQTMTGLTNTHLVDLDTGMRVAHFAEVDVNETTDVSQQAIYIRPAARLAGGHHYAVGIEFIATPAGESMVRSDAFEAVLADRDTGHARLDAARPRLRAALDGLEAAGIARDELVMAWDFTVADDAAATADGVAARDAALAAMGDLGANLSISVTDDQGTINADPRIARRIELDYESPSVTGPKFAGFHRGGDGTPVVEGMETAKAHIFVPPCATANNKAGIVIFGHGFFGDLDEIRRAEHLRQLADDGCLVFAGTEWTGMAQNDEANALLALNDLTIGFRFGERIWQGMVNQIALEQLLRGKLATQILVDGNNQSIVDTSRVFYFGISNGHILGTTFVAYDPFITRAVLMVGGANWSLMFERSKNWAAFGAPLKGAYDNLLAAVIMEEVLEMALDVVEGSNVAQYQVPGTPAKRYLLQTSLDDCQVPNISSFYQARSMGVTLLVPSPVTPFGFLTTADATSSGNAWLIVDEKPSPTPPATNLTFAFDNEAHENPRRRRAVLDQILEFWDTGTARNPCTASGPAACDCKAGNCGALLEPQFGGN